MGKGSSAPAEQTITQTSLPDYAAPRSERDATEVRDAYPLILLTGAQTAFYYQHPEYLRTGIPVALSTDDRGMWDSNLTDEFFVAVREFNLSWNELVKLSRNSLQYAFAPEPLRERMLEKLDARLLAFTAQVSAQPAAALAADAVSYGFTCRRYQLCDW